MKRRSFVARSLVLVPALALGLGARAHAAKGGSPGAIFDFTASARALGMGSAYTAMAGDATALYYNPAGLGRVRGHEIAFDHAQLYQGTTYDYLGYARQGALGGWGAEFLRLNMGGIQGRDENNVEAGGVSYAEQGLALGFGSRAFFENRLALGGSFKVLARSLGPASNRLMGADVGLQYTPAFAQRRLRWGLLAANVVGMHMGETDDRLPMLIKAGAGLQVLSGLALAFNVDNNKEYEVGTEYALGIASFRAGFQEKGPTFGAGVRFLKRWHADFAVANHNMLGMSSNISLGCRFGEEGALAKPLAVFKGTLGSAERALDAQRYREALRLYDRAMAANLDDGDPARAKVRARIERLRELVVDLKLDARAEIEDALARRGDAGALGLRAVKALMDREDVKALLLAQAAYGTDVRAQAYAALMESVGRVSFQKPARDELQPPAMLVETKLRKALDAFRAERYDESIERCGEALMLDPDSTLARMRMGSAYFAQGLREKAVLEWREALRLDPKNEALKDFMRKIGEELP